MKVSVNLYSKNDIDIPDFLNKFYNTKNIFKKTRIWSKEYDNPIELSDIIGVYIENYDKFKINMWICLDQGFLLYITKDNAEKIIRYLFERYPY